MCARQKFTPIEPQAERWPITKLHKHKKLFLQAVVESSFASLRARYPVDEELYRMLMHTSDKELVRISADPWVCDLKDDAVFWERMAWAIAHKTEATSCLLRSIIERYVREISSSFSVRHYQLMAKSMHHIFSHLLKPNCCGFRAKRWMDVQQELHKAFHIAGELDTVRALAKIGTIVLVPTHTSNWDSVIIGWAMQQLGLPPLSWGAGLNLFNHKGFRYVFNKLGTYKIDRRKRTIPYLLTQKHYACLMLEWGCHTLFYPSGTRSRSGAIESNLKLGLLSTPFTAQVHTFQKYGEATRKIFIVPVVLNYHCVLEAPQLIYEWMEHPNRLSSKACCFKNLALSKKILCDGAEIFINVGHPLDVMGNRVDRMGNSYDIQGNVINLSRQFLDQSTITKRSDDYVKILSGKIVEIYYQINLVLSSHLVAFVAYELAQHTEGFSMHADTIALAPEVFMAALAEAYKALSLLHEQKKIQFTKLLCDGNLAHIATDGLAKLGSYHVKTPLLIGANGVLHIQDLWTLCYYRNRLMGYGLEKLFAKQLQ